MSDDPLWLKDPMVWIDKQVRPVLMALACPRDGATDDDLRDRVDRAVHAMRVEGVERIAAFDVDPPPGLGACVDRAESALRDGLTNPPSPETVRDEVAPAVEAVMDAYRAAFLTHVVTTQMTHRRLVQEARQDLGRIARMIHFVALNASIESARIGPEGAGMVQISQEMRSLAIRTGDTLSRLSDDRPA